MSQGLVTASYIVAAVLFILSLAGLSKQETAKHGNLFGIAGMAIALLATVFNPETSGVHWIILAMAIGGAIGVRLALKVEMTEMPELVAVLHSFVGMAAVLVGFNSYLYHTPGLEPPPLKWWSPSVPTWMRPWQPPGRRSSRRQASPRSSTSPAPC